MKTKRNLFAMLVGVIILTGMASVSFGSYFPMCPTIKVHRITADTAPIQDAWTDCSKFLQIADETQGSVAVLAADSMHIAILRDGMYMFGGCIHFQNNSGGDKTPLVASRLFLNETDELRCSQRAWSGTVKDGGENVLSYNGTASFSAGDTLTLQYYLNDNTIDFTSNAVFANQVAYTLWLVRCGSKQ